MSSSPEAFSTTSAGVPVAAATKPVVPPVKRLSTLRSMLRRMMFGLLFVLPIVLTSLIFYYIYVTLNDWLIEPVAKLIIPKETMLPYWEEIQAYVTTPIALA